MTHQPVFLCSAKRTPIGSFNGSLSSRSATELGSHVIAAVLENAGVLPEAIDEVIMGCVLTAGVGQAPARQAALGAGLPNTVQALTVNKVCSSGLKAVMLGANEIALGHSRAIIAGGMESMSNSPYLLPAMRSGSKLGHSQAIDSIIKDGLWDVYNDYHMGNAAELCAREYKLSREQQDEFAIESYRRANDAIANGNFKSEIAPIEVRQERETVTISSDEEPPRGKPEKIPNLKPVFDKSGTVTAANASSLNDGAAAMLLCSEEFAKEHSLTPLAQLISQGWYAHAPEWFTTAPVGAVEKALNKANCTAEDIDLFEINEAFSGVALACQSDLGIPASKLNIHGGAVALGHPIGASGARILTTLLHAMQQRDVKLGAVGICNGGGEATAVVVKR